MSDEPRLFLNVAMFSASEPSPVAGALTMDLVMTVYMPTNTPFRYEPTSLAQRLNSVLPGRGYTPAVLAAHEAEVRTFFTVLGDGRWVPSPEYFSMTDGNPGSAS